MPSNFETQLQKYADLAVRVGLNLQPGQRLILGRAVPLNMAPLVRAIARSAYQAGARHVDVVWGDPELVRLRFELAPRDSFDEYPAWRFQGMVEHAERGDALLTILGEDPDLLKDQDPALVGTLLSAIARQRQPLGRLIASNASNWCVLAVPTAGAAARIFPELPAEEQVPALWQAIFSVCRVDQPDPVAAWQAHIAQLQARSRYLTEKRYQGLKFTGPGTDLTMGLPPGHRWISGTGTSQAGITFVPNLPTEEVFTLPDRDRVEGVVASSLPLSFGGALVENFSLTFAEGKVVDLAAEKGEAVLRQMIATDEAAGRLGEVALVPCSSPVGRLGRLFYNGLLDENAASHLALGRAYKFCLEGGTDMTDEAFVAAGGNLSALHVDFMVGSAAMDVDGLRPDGSREPVMRNGEWAFDV